MPKAIHDPTTPALRLGQHPRHPGRPALLNEAGKPQITFPTNTTRAEIACKLVAGGYTLHDDDAVTPDGLPSVFSLGLHLAAANRDHRAADRAMIASKADRYALAIHEAALELLTTRADALRDLIATIAPWTLADAAVQVNVACDIADDLYSNEISQEETAKLTAKLRRILFGALPILADAAGLDMEAMQWTEAIALRDHAYGGTASPLADGSA